MALSIIFAPEPQTKLEDGYEIELDAVISREHNYAAQVTTSPIEGGEVISDHAILQPITITIEGFISDYPVKYFGEGTPEISGEERSKTAYEALRELWETRSLITVTTRLTTYEDMIIKSLRIPESPRRGQALWFTATLQQVQVVNSEMTEVPKDVVENESKQAKKKTSKGKKNVKPTSQTSPAGQKESLLYKLLF